LIREDGPPAILFENDIATSLIVPKAYWSIVTGPPASLRTAAELLDSRKNSPNRGLASHQNPMPDYCITLPTT
jgi:hypothetical protein